MSDLFAHHFTIGRRDLAELGIVECPYLTEPCLDFSRARSPSRALRRWRKKGIRGHGIFERPSRSAYHDKVADVIYMHPEMARKMRRQIAARVEHDINRAFFAWPKAGTAMGGNG